MFRARLLSGVAFYLLRASRFSPLPVTGVIQRIHHLLNRKNLNSAHYGVVVGVITDCEESLWLTAGWSSEDPKVRMVAGEPAPWNSQLERGFSGC
jgi:hypothetical protein